MSDFLTALTALASGLWWLWLFLAAFAVAAAVVAAVVLLAANGAVAVLVHIDDRRGTSVDDLMDGDDWARTTGHLNETTETWLFEAPEFQNATPDRAAAVLFAASVMADIDDLPEAAG